MASTEHGLGASVASVCARPGVLLERDAAGHAHVMQFVGPLGVVTHETNVPGSLSADEAVFMPHFMPG
jgi:hypothetical protein